MAKQQCVGPLQTPWPNVAVVALSHQELVGPPQPWESSQSKSLLDPKVAARLAVAEALTNLVFALVTDLQVSPLRLLAWNSRPVGRNPFTIHLPAGLQPPYTYGSLSNASLHLPGCEMQRELDVGGQAPRGRVQLNDACEAMVAVMAAGCNVDGGLDSSAWLPGLALKPMRAPGEGLGARGQGARPVSSDSTPHMLMP